MLVCLFARLLVLTSVNVEERDLRDHGTVDLNENFALQNLAQPPQDLVPILTSVDVPNVFQVLEDSFASRRGNVQVSAGGVERERKRERKGGGEKKRVSNKNRRISSKYLSVS